MCNKNKEKRIQFYSKWVIYLPIIGMAILFCLFLSPEILTLINQKTLIVSSISSLPYSERFSLFLASAITIFTLIGSYSTYMQVVLARERNFIEDTRNELKEAYGPLYSILNYPVKTGEKSVKISIEDFKTIDKIISVYPWIFSKQIRDSWNETRRPTPSISMREMQMGQREPLHDVLLDFRKKINEEYHHKVGIYNKLLGKEEEKNS
jgi:hypothetical protein